MTTDVSSKLSSVANYPRPLRDINEAVRSGFPLGLSDYTEFAMQACQDRQQLLILLLELRDILEPAADINDHFSACDRTMGPSHPCTCGMDKYKREQL